MWDEAKRKASTTWMKASQNKEESSQQYLCNNGVKIEEK